MSLLPASELPDSLIEVSDVILHIGVYTIWMILALFGQAGSIRFPTNKQAGISLTIALLFSFGVELLQGFATDYRSFDWYDLVSNTIGCLLGVLIYKLIIRFLSKN